MNGIHNSLYQARLFPWVIVRQLPNLQRITVGRFRNRSYAEGHLRILQQLMPDGQFAIAFELPSCTIPDYILPRFKGYSARSPSSQEDS